ncbi:MAG: DUF4803 domain-containing protein [Armatimonadota bacterium]|nr:DUF4803 domain-containing protein [Armatimonadota bacterium]
MADILQEHGLELAPERNRETTCPGYAEQLDGWHRVPMWWLARCDRYGSDRRIQSSSRPVVADFCDQPLPQGEI